VRDVSDHDRSGRFVNLIHNSVVADSDSEDALEPLELFAAAGSRIDLERLDLGSDALL
jgi:hypothetical protein